MLTTTDVFQIEIFGTNSIQEKVLKAKQSIEYYFALNELHLG